MIRMIVIGTVSHDNIRLPLSNQSNQLLPILQGGHEFAIVIVHHMRLDLQDSGCFIHFPHPSLRQFPARRHGVTDVSIGRRDELDLVPLPGPHRRHPSRLDFTIVGMGTKHDDPQFAIVLGQRTQGQREDNNNPQAPKPELRYVTIQRF